LSEESRRVMAALDPIEVVITNFAEAMTGKPLDYEVANSPTNESMGFHKVTATSTIYLDSSDFRSKADADYYGLAQNQAVGLKYLGGILVCDKVVESVDGKTKKLECHLDVSESPTKPKSWISWVPSDSLKCEVRVYNPLFVVTEPTSDWVQELNPQSEIVYENALVDPSASDLIDGTTVSKWKSNPAVQFERMGYYVVDYETEFHKDSNPTGKIVLNRTVSLKEEVAKKKISQAEKDKLDERRNQQKAQTEAKERRMQIEPVNYFKEWDDYKGKYSAYDDKGIPTHLADGTALAKSAIKKLAKELQKHVKQQAAWKKANES